MSADFQFDVFLSHSAKDKQAVPVPNVVRELAARLQRDGAYPNAECRMQNAEILHSSFFLHPFPDAPIKGSLAQFLYINSKVLFHIHE